jgi:hypothetical protein
VTSGLAVANAGLPLVITHKPGSMFITDIEVCRSPWVALGGGGGWTPRGALRAAGVVGRPPGVPGGGSRHPGGPLRLLNPCHGLHQRH